MNLKISGDGVEVTPAIREYVIEKLDRVTRHFDQVVDITVLIKFNPHKDEAHRHTVSIDLHVKGHDIHVEDTNGNMYATIIKVVLCLDRQVVRHKDRMQSHHHLASGRLTAPA